MKSLDKIKEEYRGMFENFPTSALWYEPVWNFFETKLIEARKAGYLEGARMQSVIDRNI